jgi:hypothetical protein
MNENTGKTIFEKMGITYKQAEDGDYLIPDIELPEQKPVNKYGLIRMDYIKVHKPLLWNRLMCRGTLNAHLHEIGETAYDRVELLIEELMKKDPPPDKATNQMGWVGHMNALKAQAEEIVLAELIYV